MFNLITEECWRSTSFENCINASFLSAIIWSKDIADIWYFDHVVE